MIAITGATGQLGRLVIDALLKSVPADQIVAAVRSPDKAADLGALGVQVRRADYGDPASLENAFAGVDRLLLISSSEYVGRLVQHQTVIDAALSAGIGQIAYTSMLHADRSAAKLAREHWETEQAIATSGIPAVILRNGWYTENYLLALQPALEQGAIIGSARDGRISLAARADYAAAAAAVLATDGHAGKVYELAGDVAVTLAGLAAGIAAQSGRPLTYQDLPEPDYKGALVGAGLPDLLAEMLADADARAADGALFDDSRQLSALIGRPTTPVPETVADALRG